jgi:PAS domain S-box-containing protein
MSAARMSQGAFSEIVSYTVFGIALDGTVQSWSSGAEDLYGFRSDEIVGKPHTLLAPPERRNELEEALTRLRHGEETVHLEMVCVSLDLSSLRNEHGELIGVSAVAGRRGARERREEISAARIAGLQAVTAALSRAVTPAAVARVFVREGAAAVGASGGFIRRLTPDGLNLRLEAAVGYSKRFEETYRDLPVTSELPGAAAFRGVSEIYFESAGAAAASTEFAREHAATGHEAVAFVPLRTSHGGAIGVLALSFLEARVFAEEDRELLRTLADQCSQALERAQLYRTERRARGAAERAVERTLRLQSLAAELAETLTPVQVAEVVVTQGIASTGADAGALQLLNSDRTMLEVVYGLGSDRTLIDDEWRAFSANAKLPSADALHRLQPVFIESAEDIRTHYPLLEGSARSAARAGAHIPLVVSGAPLGVLFLGFSRPRRFSKSQRSFVLALGRQGAQALKRAQLYEAESQGRSGLSRLVERLHEGVVSVARGGRVEFASSKAKEMLRPALLEEGRRVPETWFGFPLRTFAAELFVVDDAAIEARVMSEDGERVFEITGIPAARSDAALLVLTDVSERERRWRAEREFVDNAAHELRTPLAAITSAIERLQAGARDEPEKRDRFLGYIEQESNRLNRLASSLLVLARAQTREEAPRSEEIVLRPLMEDLFSGLAVHDGVELVVDCADDVVVWSNRDLLEHALLNLASNAARHTESGSIRARATSDAAGSATIELEDTGAGIRPEELDRLFDRFYRGPTEEKRSGFGLGLPIVKESVEALGGQIVIESAVGVGTAARIVLPAARPVLA